MLNRRTDFDPEEQEFLKSFGTSPEELLARKATCPPPEVLLAAQSENWPEERRAEVLAHLAGCRRCSVLLRDLSDPELAELQPEEAARIRRRTFDAIAPRWWARPSLALAATLAVAVVGALLWYSSNVVVEPQPRPIVLRAQPRPTVLRVEAAPVKLPASILVWRGEGGGYAADLGGAIKLYRDGQYGDAAQKLEALTRNHPPTVEGHFYLGVSQLLVGRDSEARTNLVRARELDRGSLADDIAWYLALAHVKTGDGAEALTELRALCGKPGEYSARACAGIEEIETKAKGR